MEMTAIAAALEVVKPGEPEPIVIYSDNRLVLDGMGGWLQKWEANGWRKADKKPVVNRDIWERLIAATAEKSIEWRHVKAHAGHPFNEEVDRLAKVQMQEAHDAFFGLST